MTRDMRPQVLKLLNSCADNLINSYFEPRNVDSLQLNLQAVIKQLSGVKIDRQPDNLVMLAMIQAYQNRQAGDTVATLTTSAVRQLTPGIITNLKQLGIYLNSRKAPPEPLPLPLNTSSSKTIDLRRQVQ